MAGLYDDMPQRGIKAEFDEIDEEWWERERNVHLFLNVAWAFGILVAIAGMLGFIWG